MKVAVYGSLLKGLYNHTIIKDSKYLGTFESAHNYTMYDLGAFPGIIEKGNTSLTLEVYNVTKQKLEDLDRLEGFIKNSKISLYTRRIIRTPFGISFIYIYNKNKKDIKGDKVKSGNWKEYLNDKNYEKVH